MGADGKHLRMQIASEGARCGAVAFGKGEALEALQSSGHRRRRLPARGALVPRRALAAALARRAARRRRRRAAITAAPALPSWRPAPTSCRSLRVPSEGPRVRDARDGGGLALAATLAASGASVCVLVNDLAPRCGEIVGDARRLALRGRRSPCWCPGGSPPGRARRARRSRPRRALAAIEHRAFARLAVAARRVRARRGARAARCTPRRPRRCARCPRPRRCTSPTAPRDLAAARAAAEREAPAPADGGALARGRAGRARSTRARSSRRSTGREPASRRRRPARPAAEAIEVLVELGLAERDGDRLCLATPSGRLGPGGVGDIRTCRGATT